MKIHIQRDKMKIALGQALTLVNDTLEILERKTTSNNPDVDIIALKSVNFETDVRPVLMELRTVINNWSFSDVFNDIPASELIRDEDECEFQQVWADIANPGRNLTGGDND